MASRNLDDLQDHIQEKAHELLHLYGLKEVQFLLTVLIHGHCYKLIHQHLFSIDTTSPSKI